MNSSLKLIIITTIALITLSYLAPYIITAEASSLNTKEFIVVDIRWVTSKGEKAIAPGDVVSLTITLKYCGDSQVSGVIARLALPQHIVPYGGSEAIASYGGLISKSSPIVQLHYQLMVLSNTPIGVYHLTLTLDYDELNISSNSWMHKTETHDLVMFIVGRPKLNIAIVNKSLIAGSQKVTLSLVNIGEKTAWDVVVEVTSTSALILNDTIRINSIEPGDKEYVNVWLYVPSSLKGSTLTLNVKVRYVGSYSTEYSITKTFTLSVGMLESPKVDIELINDTVGTGWHQLYIVLINNDSETIYNVTLSVKSSNILINIPSDYRIINEVLGGSNRTIPLRVYIPQKLEGSLATFTLELSFTDYLGVTHYVVRTFNILVNRSYSQVVHVFLDTNVLYSSKENNITLIIINGGPRKLSSVRITLKPTYPLRINGTSTITINNLDVGSLKEVNLSLFVYPINNRLSLQLPISMEFIDEFGNIATYDTVQQLTIMPTQPYECVTLSIKSKVLRNIGNESLLIEVTNNCDKIVTDVRLSIDVQSTKVVISTKSIYLGMLRPNDVRIIKVPMVILHGATGIVPISLSIQYIDYLGLEHGYTKIEVIKIIPRQTSLTININPILLPSQSIVNASLTLVNDGDVDINNLTIRLSTILNSGLMILNNSTFKVDSLPRGCETYVELRLRTPSVISTTILPINVDVEYYDDQYNYYMKSYVLNVEIIPEFKTSIVDVELSPKVFKALSSSELELRIINRGNISIRSLELSINDLGPLVPTKPLNTLILNSIGPGEVRVVNISVLISYSPGSYEVSFSLKYVDSEGNTYSEKVNDIIRVEPSRTPLSVYLEPRTLTSLDISDLEIKILNVGDVELRDINVELNLPQYLIPLTNTSFYIDVLRPGEARILTSKVKPAYVGNVVVAKVVLSIEFLDPLLETYRITKEFNIELMPTSIPRPIIKVATNELVMGKVNKVYIKLLNKFNYSIRSVELSLASTGNIVLLNQTRIYVGDIEPNSEKDVVLSVYAPSTVSSSGAISITVSYIDERSGNYESFKLTKSFLLRGLVEIELVDVSVIPEEPSPGQPFSIALTITNIGTSTAYALYAIPLIKSLPLKIYGTKSTYVGNVEVNVPITFTITLMLSREVKEDIRSLEIPIILIYMDNLRTIHNVTLTVPVTIAHETLTTTHGMVSSAGSISVEIDLRLLLTIIAVFAMLVFIVLMRRIRR